VKFGEYRHLPPEEVVVTGIANFGVADNPSAIYNVTINDGCEFCKSFQGRLGGPTL